MGEHTVDVSVDLPADTGPAPAEGVILGQVFLGLLVDVGVEKGDVSRVLVVGVGIVEGQLGIGCGQALEHPPLDEHEPGGPVFDREQAREAVRPAAGLELDRVVQRGRLGHPVHGRGIDGAQLVHVQVLDRIDAADHVLVGLQILPGQLGLKADVRVDEKQMRVGFLAQEFVGDEVARPGDETFLTRGQKPGPDALLLQKADHLDQRAHGFQFHRSVFFRGISGGGGRLPREPGARADPRGLHGAQKQDDEKEEDGLLGLGQVQVFLVYLHVADAVDGDQRAHDGNDEHHDQAQVVGEKRRGVAVVLEDEEFEPDEPGDLGQGQPNDDLIFSLETDEKHHEEDDEVT